MSLLSEYEKVQLAIESVVELLNGQHFEAATLISKKLIIESEKFRLQLEPKIVVEPVVVTVEPAPFIGITESIVQPVEELAPVPEPTLV